MLIANIKFDGKKLKAIPLKSETRQAVHSFHNHSRKYLLEVLAKAIRQLKKIKGIQIGNEKVKVSLFADDIIVYISDPKNSTRNLLQLKNSLSKVTVLQD